MGYFFLLITLLTGASKGYCGKRTSGYVQEYQGAVLTNLLRMTFCIIIGFGIVLLQKNVSALRISLPVFFITLLAGAANVASVVGWLLVIRRGAYMMVDVFCTLGILLPLSGCALLFNEAIELNHIIGIFLLFIAVFLMCSYNNSIKTKMTASTFLLLVLCGIANGFMDFSQKLFVKLCADTPVSIFNFYTYLFSSLILFLLFLLSRQKEGIKTGKNTIQPIFLYILIMALCLFSTSYFKTMAAQFLPSALLYPLSQGGSLILSTAMSAVLFHERLTLKCIAGLTLCFIALIIINVL